MPIGPATGLLLPSRLLRAQPKVKTILKFLVCAAALHAHEIGTSRVSVVVHEDRTYTVEIVTDAATLAEKLEASAGRPALTESRADRLQTLLENSTGQFRKRVKLVFDSTEVYPAISYSVTPAIDAMSAPPATIRLTGPIPEGARNFTWTYAWTFASYAITFRNSPTANPETVWLEGNQTSAPFALTSAQPPTGSLNTAWRYLTLGFTHIMPNGVDHMLFVLGIYLLNSRPKSVLLQVSAFTLAHSITLGLSMYGLIDVSPAIVEPLIALSIAYVAIENLFLSELKSWRVALVFAFGLLHGMGFAGALKELALPHSEFLTALVTFNIGVEAGQLAVIGVAFLLVGWHCSNRVWYRTRVAIPASMMIACTAVYWTFERLSL